MDTAAIIDMVASQFPSGVAGKQLEALDPWIEIEGPSLEPVCRYLRDEPSLRFNFLHCISGIDYFEKDAKKAAKVEWQPHIEVVYHLSSMVHRHRLVLKVILPRWKDGVEGQLPEVPTVSHLWKTANWHEREVYDLSGIVFTGHPDFRRILCPEDWVGHPLRKDYEMPLEYHGIRAR